MPLPWRHVGMSRVRLSVLALVGLCGANPNAVGRVPPMGWSGYLALMQNSGKCDRAGASGYNESTFLETADFLVSSGLRDVGYSLISAGARGVCARTRRGQVAQGVLRVTGASR